MDSLHSTMNQHVKGKYLSFEERVIIQLRLKDGYSLRAIARELNCSPSTISYEVKRGTVKLYHGKVKKYKATQGHDAYKAHRKKLWAQIRLSQESSIHALCPQAFF